MIPAILASLVFAIPLIWAAPHLDGEATREINKTEDNAAEAKWWLMRMNGATQ